MRERGEGEKGGREGKEDTIIPPCGGCTRQQALPFSSYTIAWDFQSRRGVLPYKVIKDEPFYIREGDGRGAMWVRGEEMMMKDTIASSSLTFAILVESGRMQEVWRMLMSGRGKGVILLLVVAIVSPRIPLRALLHA